MLSHVSTHSEYSYSNAVCYRYLRFIWCRLDLIHVSLIISLPISENYFFFVVRFVGHCMRNQEKEERNHIRLQSTIFFVGEIDTLPSNVEII